MHHSKRPRGLICHDVKNYFFLYIHAEYWPNILLKIESLLLFEICFYLNKFILLNLCGDHLRQTKLSVVGRQSEARGEH